MREHEFFNLVDGLFRKGPVNGWLPETLEMIVDETEVAAPEEATSGTVRRRVSCLEDDAITNMLCNAFGFLAPQNEDNFRVGVHDSSKNLHYEWIPDLSVRIGLMGLNGKAGVEKKNSLPGPGREISVRWNLEVGIA